ncbi:hypothetical protein GCM10009632_05100 [Mycolicibacterium alvei]|uniref:Uncharacterized protein n=1 Tax=Mycolicibacterium alvei TaxID=67081 RepID=A0A6N4V2N5_9MYCO|nr:hypothetical protein MALV_56700 [Mycolicibacterium alvei]
MQVLGGLTVGVIVALLFAVVFVGVFVHHFWPLLLAGYVIWGLVKLVQHFRRDSTYGAPPPIPADYYRS